MVFVGLCPTPRPGDGGKRVPSGHNGEAVSDPQSSTETSAGYSSSLHED